MTTMYPDQGRGSPRGETVRDWVDTVVHQNTHSSCAKRLLRTAALKAIAEAFANSAIWIAY